MNLPSIEELQKCLWVEDPEFLAWVDTVPDKHWAKLDLSALRIGFELGKLHPFESQPTVKDGN